MLFEDSGLFQQIWGPSTPFGWRLHFARDDKALVKGREASVEKQIDGLRAGSL
jgi:hypothetical protein